MDSQSVKHCYGGDEIGYDANKKVKGRKRHIITDSQGNLMAVVVHAADMQDRVGAKRLIDKIKGKFNRLQLIIADGAYPGPIQNYSVLNIGARIAIAKKISDSSFIPIPKRWVVERTFAWLNNSRILAKDYTKNPKTHESWILIDTIRRILKKIIPNAC
jgi:transposase